MLQITLHLLFATLKVYFSYLFLKAEVLFKRLVYTKLQAIWSPYCSMSQNQGT